MCSILGINSKQLLPAKEAIQYLHTLQHRGPDGVGLIGENLHAFARTYHSAFNAYETVKSKWWIGNGLLSLTGKGNPPYTKNEITLAHNGEIYNYHELAQKYHIPISKNTSDSQVLCELIAKWMQQQTIHEIAKRLHAEVRGSYAIVLYAHEKMYAFRDAIGKKPIWVHEGKEKVVFSSEPLHTTAFLLPPTQLAIAANGKLQLRPISFASPKSFDLEKAWKESIALRVQGHQRIAVSFSGGVDSALVALTAKKLGKTVIGVGVGMPGSHDEMQAKAAAKALGITLNWKKLTPKEVQKIAGELPQILHSTDYLQQSIGVVNALTAAYAQKRGFRFLLSGTGADELFCGYGEFERVRGKKKEAEAMREKRMNEMWKQNLWREDACTMRAGVELRTPYLDQHVVQAAIAIPAWKNLTGKNGLLRKAALRELAIALGMPPEIALQPKKAMQYGSGVAKVLEKSHVNA